MSLEAALAFWLSEQPAVAAKIGARIYPQKRQQGDPLPALVYQRVSGNTVKHLGGLAGVAKSSIQLDFLGNTLAEAEALALAVRGTQGAPGLDGFRGPITYPESDGSEVTLRVQAARLSNNQEQLERPIHGDDAGVPHVPLVFDIWYEEP